MYQNDMRTPLKMAYTHFLENNGFMNFSGIDGAIRGSKCISVYIYKDAKQEFEKLNGGSDGYRRYWVIPIWEGEDFIRYNVSCVKIK